MNIETLAFYVLSGLVVLELGVICYITKLLAASRVARDGHDFRTALSGPDKPPKEPKDKARAY